MAKVQNDEEILPKVSTPEYRAHEHYRRQTDDRRICDIEDPNTFG